MSRLSGMTEQSMSRLSGVMGQVLRTVPRLKEESMSDMTLTIKLTDDEDGRTKLARITKALDMALALGEIDNQLFRPQRKHGYSNPRLEALSNNDEVAQAIDILSQMYERILLEYGIRLNELSY